MFINNAVCVCDRGDCFAASESIKTPGEHHCKALRDNDFEGKPCPFFKTKEEQKASEYAAEQRRIALAKARKEKEAMQDVRTISGVMFRGKERRNG